MTGQLRLEDFECDFAITDFVVNAVDGTDAAFAEHLCNLESAADVVAWFKLHFLLPSSNHKKCLESPLHPQHKAIRFFELAV